MPLSLVLSCALAVASPHLTAQGQPVHLGAAASVEPECTVGTIPLRFGPYNPIGANRTDPLVAEGAVVLQCTKGMRLTITLGPGGHTTGQTRAMAQTNGRDALTYELYQDRQRSVLWTGTSPVVVGSAGLKPIGLAVYGRIPAGQDVGAGVYSDSVVVTVTY